MAVKPTVGDHGVPVVAAKAGDWGTWYPNVASWLCDSAFPDGTPIDQTRLSLRRVGATIIACLQTAACGGVRIEGQGDSPDNAIAVLEALLGHDPAPWTIDPYPIGKPLGKKK